MSLEMENQTAEHHIKNLKWLLNRKNYTWRNMPSEEEFAGWKQQLEEERRGIDTRIKRIKRGEPAGPREPPQPACEKGQFLFDF